MAKNPFYLDARGWEVDQPFLLLERPPDLVYFYIVNPVRRMRFNFLECHGALSPHPV